MHVGPYDRVRRLGVVAAPWWQEAVIYQIYPRSFADSNQDGVGDLQGIRSHLNHLVRLGVDAIWLSPFYRSPMADFGYDVSDYCDVDPLFGTLADFDALLADAHSVGLRVIVDWVPNHTSDRHPWFEEARRSLDSPKRDFYVWRDPPADGSPPNNWVQTWTDGGPAWTLDDRTDQWYLHLFLPEQPDLNWANPAVESAMHDVLRFWLDRGVDGFRMDVLHAIGKHPDLVDDPPEYLPIPHSALNHHSSTHDLVRGLRGVLEEYEGDRMMVGEVFLLDTALVATYYGSGDGVHMAFNFPPLMTPWNARLFRARIEDVEREIEPLGWPSWVLSNHDNPRHRTRYATQARARAAAVLLLTLRGTPFLYAGEELGLEDATVPSERVVDPGGRDGCRAPIPWDPRPGHGWGEGEPWLPWPPDTATRNAETEDGDPGSMLELYRRLLRLRRASSALRSGRQELLDAPEGVLAWRRWAGDSVQPEDERIVLINFTDRPVSIRGDLAAGQVLASTVRSEGLSAPVDALEPDEALIVEPS